MYSVVLYYRCKQTNQQTPTSREKSGKRQKEKKMKATTIHTNEELQLPRWAKRHEEVVELCKKDIAFRCEVYAAETSTYKKFLVKEARRRATK